MIRTRSARTIRRAILDARKFVRLCNRGYTGLEGGNLKGLYGKAYIRTAFSYKVDGARTCSKWPLGIVSGDL